MQKALGFTLAELLIALGILGLIATFTIPKVLSAQQNDKRVALVKEAASAFSGAYQVLLKDTQVNSTTKVANLTPYLNYVKLDTSGVLVDAGGSGTWGCSASGPCIRLTSGAVIHYDNTKSFGGNSTLNVLYVQIDPDGINTQATGAASDTVPIFLYFNGRLTDEGHLLVGTVDSSGSYSANPGNIPSWFAW